MGDPHLPVALALRAGRQQDHAERGVRQLPYLLGRDGQRRLGLLGGEQRGGDGGGAGDPALAAAALLVQPGVLDRHAGCGGEGVHHLLVLGGEGAAALLLGEVEVAEHLLADPDRHAQEGLHLRVVRREPGGARVGAEVGQPQRLGAVDERAEDAAAGGQFADRGGGVVGHADVDEVGQAGAAWGDHAECRVPGVDQFGGAGGDPVQGGVQVQPGADGDHRLQQPLHPVGDGGGRLQALGDLGDQGVQPERGDLGHPMGCRLGGGLGEVRRGVHGESLVCTLFSRRVARLAVTR